MKYYVTTTEQVYNDGNLGEYMTKSDMLRIPRKQHVIFTTKH